MNKVTRASDIVTPKVTTGPVQGSRKVYVAPEDAPSLRIPFREIVLSEASGEAPFRVYDSSGPYTDATAAIDVEKGLPRLRDAWVQERGGVEAYDGRAVKPEDNGNVSDSHAARVFPTVFRPLRAMIGESVPSSPLTSTGRADTGNSEASRTSFTPAPNPSPQGGGEIEGRGIGSHDKALSSQGANTKYAQGHLKWPINIVVRSRRGSTVRRSSSC